MPLYLIQGQQTSDTWRRLIAHPEDRAKASRDGAHLHQSRSVGYWYALGEWHVYSIIEAEDETAAAGLLSAMLGSGAFARMHVTQLLTVEQMLDALTRARETTYVPPGGRAPDAHRGEA